MPGHRTSQCAGLLAVAPVLLRPTPSSLARVPRRLCALPLALGAQQPLHTDGAQLGLENEQMKGVPREPGEGTACSRRAELAKAGPCLRLPSRRALCSGSRRGAGQERVGGRGWWKEEALAWLRGRGRGQGQRH